MDQQAKVGASFYNFDVFLKNLESLDQVFSTVRQNLKTDQQFNEHHQTSEADKILEDLGCVDVVTKSESGKMFYSQVAKQIDQIFGKLLPTKGGVMSLIDVYLYYNRMRGSDLVTSQDLLMAARELDSINSTIELKLLPNGLKILQMKTRDKQAEIYEIRQMILKSNGTGLTVEDYCKSKDLSSIIGRYKLEEYSKEGHFCLDSSMGGLKYFNNDIITFEFN